MSCGLTAGKSRGCRDVTPGILEFYIGNMNDSTVVSDDGNGTVTGITNFSAFTFVPNKKSSDITEDSTPSMEANTIEYQQNANIVLGKLEAALRNQIYLIGQADMLVIGLDKNDRYWLIGAQNGAMLNSSNGSTGKGGTDVNGYSIQISAFEPQPIYEVSSTIIAALLA